VFRITVGNEMASPAKERGYYETPWALMQPGVGAYDDVVARKPTSSHCE